MFKYYLDKILAYLQRQLSPSEVEVVEEKFFSGWNWKATAEYLR